MDFKGVARGVGGAHQCSPKEKNGNQFTFSHTPPSSFPSRAAAAPHNSRLFKLIDFASHDFGGGGRGEETLCASFQAHHIST